MTNPKQNRVNGLQNVLSELPKCNLATLDAILTHLSRLVSIVGTQDKDLVDFNAN